MADSKFKEFKKNGFYVYKNAISKDLIGVVSRYYHELVNSGKLNHVDTQVPGAYSIAEDAKYSEMQDALLHILTQKYNNFLGDVRVRPTYAYSRYYMNGNVLMPHKDRAECELSATLTIDFDKQWPIFIRDYEGKAHEVEMEPGDLVFYHGCDLEHWREEFIGQYAIQIFLHFVSLDNPESDVLEENRNVRKLQNQYWINNKNFNGVRRRTNWPGYKSEEDWNE